MDVVSLETREEMEKFVKLAALNKGLFDDYVHIGGTTTVGKSTNNWYWVNSGNRVQYTLPLLKEGNDFKNNNEWCLTVKTGPDGVLAFNDIDCNGSVYSLVCQKIRNVYSSHN